MTSSVTTEYAPHRLREKERAENFPVAMLFLPPAIRRDLRAIYDVVRVIDDLGDRASGDRTKLLKDFSADLARAWQGEATREAVVQRLAPVVTAHQLDRRAFDQLIEANLIDQTISTYQTFDDLLAYCMLSAAPVGRLVLEVFGQSTAPNRELSDRICVALQLVEHWQDVAEDRLAGRTYLPQEDLSHFDVPPIDLLVRPTTKPLRRLVAFEADRASDLLESGEPLVAELHGWARLAVAGYVAGGRAAVEALRRADGDVMAGPPRPRRRDVIRHLLRQLAVAGR